jgi:hypothetical protein
VPSFVKASCGLTNTLPDEASGNELGADTNTLLYANTTKWVTLAVADDTIIVELVTREVTDAEPTDTPEID